MKRRVSAFIALALYTVCLLSGCFAATYRDTPESDVPDFKQADKRWAMTMYSNHGDITQTLRDHGCAVCVAADIVAYWFDSTVTPVDMAELSYKFGTIADRSGTKDTFWVMLAKRYPFKAFKVTDDIETAIECLNDGGLVCAKTLYKGKGHAILLYAYVDGEFYWREPSCLDPFLSLIIGHGSYEEVMDKAIKYRCYWR